MFLRVSEVHICGYVYVSARQTTHQSSRPSDHPRELLTSSDYSDSIVLSWLNRCGLIIGKGESEEKSTDMYAEISRLVIMLFIETEDRKTEAPF